jgi:hypothetical protein
MRRRRTDRPPPPKGEVTLALPLDEARELAKGKPSRLLVDYVRLLLAKADRPRASGSIPVDRHNEGNAPPRSEGPSMTP